MDNEPGADNGEGVKEFRIEQLFGSKTRARLLTLFLENADRAFYVRELTRRIDAQLNSVRRELKNLVDVGIVSEVEGKIIAAEVSDEEPESKGEKKKFYRANVEFPLFEDLRGVMRKAAVLMNQEIVRVLKEKGDISLVLLTGRFVDAEDVPTDLFIVGTIEPEDLAKAVREFERDIAREVNYTAMPREEFLYRQDVGDRFLAGILNAKHVVLWSTLPKV
jgi:DNA-binding transcriptional regulator YhcF (GntR family)